MALYANISGQVGYNPWLVEPIPLDVDNNVDPYFFPFNTKNPDHIGNHLVAVGHILKALSPGPSAGKTVLEYGCGNGFTTIFLATAGYDVTAVDINADALKVLGRLSARRGLNVRTHNGVFGDIPIQGARFDHILFYEAFHHCIGFADLLRTMHGQIKPGGSVIFAGEPVFPDFSKPWGLRLDGASLWEIRTNGWLELGFREDFFEEALRRTGWSMQKLSYDGFPPLFIAREAS
jgi:SAM-dependent methyltransferase